MPETEDIAQDVLGEAGDQEQDENKKGPFVMEQIVILIECCLAYEFVHEGPAKGL